MNRSIGLRALLVCGVMTSALGCSRFMPTPDAPRLKNSTSAAGTRPLLVDWGSNDRALLNTTRSRGPLIVGVEGSSMQLLHDCRVKGRYRYNAERSAQVQDDIISTQAELSVKMPMFGSQFRTALGDEGKLHVRMKVVGTYVADKTTFDRYDLDGTCENATHVATYVTVGAFRLFRLSKAQVTGDVGLPQGGISGGARSSEQSLNEAGDEASCAKATAADVEPPEGCSTSLQMVLAPITDGDMPSAPPEQPRSLVALAATGAGFAIAAAATVAYLVNDGNFRELRDHCSSAKGCSTTTYDERSSSIQAWDRLSAGGWMLGGAMLVGGGIWWLSSGTASPPSQPRFGAGFDPNGSIRIRGTF